MVAAIRIQMLLESMGITGLTIKDVYVNAVAYIREDMTRFIRTTNPGGYMTLCKMFEYLEMPTT